MSISPVHQNKPNKFTLIKQRKQICEFKTILVKESSQVQSATKQNQP